MNSYTVTIFDMNHCSTASIIPSPYRCTFVLIILDNLAQLCSASGGTGCDASCRCPIWPMFLPGRLVIRLLCWRTFRYFFCYLELLISFGFIFLCIISCRIILSGYGAFGLCIAHWLISIHRSERSYLVASLIMALQLLLIRSIKQKNVDPIRWDG